ncbi:polyunsaturated fatty acid lipoxygenase ALOX15B-like [Gadus chalcogrammus]|uniref:polyunsaturated fatty acid lipoxygenase ALOX15B-like n=1 Tax=Gadus chalcogrammus TaxID=1042646 RepID=UPI0024C479A7|nr:polyunsaturated fatty acid lipoxygenase ALOX15B-like [Gadus chalcogrammus]
MVAVIVFYVEIEMDCPMSIGKLVLIELKKKQRLKPEAWFPAKVQVKSPKGETFQFPIYRWIDDDQVHLFREGTAKPGFVPETQPEIDRYSRKDELDERSVQYDWSVAEGIPDFMKVELDANGVEDVDSLPDEVRFSFTKKTVLLFNIGRGITVLTLQGYVCSTEQWESIDEISKVFSCKQTPISEHVQKNWKEDSLFGYQFLNGVNPMVIRRCSELPENLQVTDATVFLRGGRSLADEMKRGNIFLCDYKVLDGLKANMVNGKQQYLMAPLILLHKTPEDQLLPIAIQLKQEPSEDNPIFVPADSEYDWLLAKLFVRSADFQDHQLNSHLLRTHLLAEVFSVALLRKLPMVHPVFKLLVPHTRYSLQINFQGRKQLLGEGGFFPKFTASGKEGADIILQRATSSITYTSLCIRDDIKERGLESVPNFYYRDDGFQILDIINRFVEGVLGYYYKEDSDVQRDTELQTWVLDIFKHGFNSRPESV